MTPRHALGARGGRPVTLPASFEPFANLSETRSDGSGACQVGAGKGGVGSTNSAISQGNFG